MFLFTFMVRVWVPGAEFGSSMFVHEVRADSNAEPEYGNEPEHEVRRENTEA